MAGLQEYVAISFAKAEQQRLNYVEMNQTKLRSDLYQNVADHMLRADVDGKELGRQVLLPATHSRSPRDMHSKFQDCMAVCRRFGKIDLFLTMTTNPNWPEIKENQWQSVIYTNDNFDNIFIQLDV